MAHLYSTHSYEPSKIYTAYQYVCKILSMTAITDTKRSLVNDCNIIIHFLDVPNMKISIIVPSSFTNGLKFQ